MTTTELKKFLDAELEKAETRHQERLKMHTEIIDACERELIKTNIGHIPIDDYKEIVAIQNGFDSYDDLLAQGYTLDV